jgi:hypothetical protein
VYVAAIPTRGSFTKSYELQPVNDADKCQHSLGTNIKYSAKIKIYSAKGQAQFLV